MEELLTTGTSPAAAEGFQRNPFAGIWINQTGQAQAAACNALSEGIKIPLESSSVDARG